MYNLGKTSSLSEGQYPKIDTKITFRNASWITRCLYLKADLF